MHVSFTSDEGRVGYNYVKEGDSPFKKKIVTHISYGPKLGGEAIN